jgi:hypothetical protein
VADYEALGTRLRLQGAVVVQPLTRAQIEGYLTQIGEPLAAVRQALQEDPTLWELLETPLMLTIVTLTYAGEPCTAFYASGTPEAKRRDLFAAYVDRMFRRRSAMTRYTRQQTERWLAWLAWQMQQHGPTVFHLEQMQPDWFSPHQRVMLAIGIGLLVGIGVALLGGLGVGLSYRLGFGLLVGVGLGLSTGLNAGHSAYSADIRTVDILCWSWSEVRYQCPLLLGVGLLVGVGAGLVAGPLVGAAIGLLGGLSLGLSSGEVPTKTVPNEGIHRSARRALYVGLGLGLSMGLCLGLSAGLSAGLVSGLLVGANTGLLFGGRACLQHLGLRLFLVRNGSAPWRYAGFLDYAAERLFLRKVGGGYVFIHRLLQDHFAARYTERNHAANWDASQ